MSVKVTEAGRTISLVVARQEINGRMFPIRKSRVAAVGDTFPDDQVNDSVLAYAKAGERGLEYVEDGASSSDDTSTNGGGDGNPQTSTGADDPEPQPGYDALNSGDAEKAYNDAEGDVKQAILTYELAHKNRAWATKAQEAAGSGGASS